MSISSNHIKDIHPLKQNIVAETYGDRKEVFSEISGTDTVAKYQKINSTAPTSAYKLTVFQGNRKARNLKKAKRIKEIVSFLHQNSIPSFAGLNPTKISPILLTEDGSFYSFDQALAPTLKAKENLHSNLVFSHNHDSYSTIQEIIVYLNSLTKLERDEIVKSLSNDLNEKLNEIALKATASGVILSPDAFFTTFNKKQNKIIAVSVCDFDSIFVPGIDKENDFKFSNKRLPNSKELLKHNSKQIKIYHEQVMDLF